MQITFLPINKKIIINSPRNLMDILIEEEIYPNAVCGGNGTCGKCIVMVTKGNNIDNIKPEEKKLLGENMIEKGYRLSCQFNVLEDTCVIIDKKYLLNSIKEIPIVYKGEKDTSNIGVAFDIGTTTVEGVIYNLKNGKELFKISAENPQRAYGYDIISRITYCYKNKNGLDTLNRLIIKCCNEIIKEGLKACGIKDIECIKRISVAGNTVMSHIFTNNNVDGFLKVPLKFGFEGKIISKAINFGILSSKECEIVIIPNIKGYVGADILCGILVSHMNKKNEKNLLIDVGTNGEIVLSVNGKIIVCSTAAGPAFEGAGIEQGMRADKGAIISAVWEEDRLNVNVIGNGKAEGIAGSGIIDVIAEFLRHSRIDNTGMITSEGDSRLLIKENEDKSCVYITQNDIRQIQLAKAAINAGIEEILELYNVNKAELDNIYIGGSFGNNLNIQNAIEVGIFPKFSKEKIILLGNSSLDGAVRILGNTSLLEYAENISNKTEHLELALSGSFQQKFINNINF